MWWVQACFSPQLKYKAPRQRQQSSPFDLCLLPSPSFLWKRQFKWGLCAAPEARDAIEEVFNKKPCPHLHHVEIYDAQTFIDSQGCSDWIALSSRHKCHQREGRSPCPQTDRGRDWDRQTKTRRSDWYFHFRFIQTHEKVWSGQLQVQKQNINAFGSFNVIEHLIEKSIIFCNTIKLLSKSIKSLFTHTQNVFSAGWIMRLQANTRSLKAAARLIVIHRQWYRHFTGECHKNVTMDGKTSNGWTLYNRNILHCTKKFVWDFDFSFWWHSLAKLANG